MARMKLEGKTKLDILKKKPEQGEERPNLLDTKPKAKPKPKLKAYRFKPSDLMRLEELKKRVAKQTSDTISEVRLVRAGLVALSMLDDDELLKACGQIW